MTIIINLTQHDATPAQREAGVVDLSPVQRERVRALLTFDTLPTWQELDARAEKLVNECWLFNDTLDDDTPRPQVMIAGAPYLMPPLVEELLADEWHPVFAFSERVVRETVDADGRVTSLREFVHAGFVHLVEPESGPSTG